MCSEDALVTVENGIAIDMPTATVIAGKDCDYTLFTTLLEAGSERIVETGFVWGSVGNPTLSASNGSAKTASPVTAANQKISVAATGLTKTVTYYGRAYVKTAGGNVVYSNVGPAKYTARWETENGKNMTVTVPGAGERSNVYDFNTQVRSGAVEGDYLVFGRDDTANIWFAATGAKEDIWIMLTYKDWTKIKDETEPRLLGVAPMAQTSYAIGDSITIALVFDEIVDVKNSTLGSVKIQTNVTNDLSYSGGGDTNVLYFTGKVTTEFKGGYIQLKGITGSSYIKDMCDTIGTANTNTSGSTPITTTGTSAPKITLTNNGVTDGMAKAQISAQNADLLQYCFTQDSGMPTAGWMKAGSLNYTATNPALMAGTYYLHAMALNKATGEAAYERTSFTVTQKDQQEQEQKLILTADTDNSHWARSRTILLEKKGSGTLTLSVKKPDGTTQTVTGNSYTATANGAYTFTLSNGTKTVTQKVTVSKIDRTNPKVTVSAIPTAWQASAPTVTISGADTSGSGIASLQYKWVTAKDAYPTSGLISLGKTGASVSGTVAESGVTDGVNYRYYKAVDGVGNTVQGYSSALHLDRITPTITLGAAQVDGPNAVFSVTVTYGPSAGRTVCQKQGEDASLSVRGNSSFSSGTGKYTFKAAHGVNESGIYTFTAASGAGKTAAKTAPGIHQVTLDAGEGVFQSDLPGEGEVQVKITTVDNAGNSESETVTIKIKGKEQTPDAVPDYPGEKLTGLLQNTAYLIRLPDGTEIYKNTGAEGHISIQDDWFGGTISVIKKGDGVNTEDSVPQSLALAARPAAPSLAKSDETIKGKKDGQITGLTTAMEYSTDGGRTWTAAAGNFTDVSAGKYLVRLSATQTAPHGKTTEAVVGEGRTLTVTFDLQGGSSVSPVAGLSWRVTVAKPADPEKADMVFAGWFKEASCANPWHFASEDAVDRVEADVTLYAKWLPKAALCGDGYGFHVGNCRKDGQKVQPAER